MQDVAEKLKFFFLTDAAIKRKNTEKQRRSGEFPTQHNQETRTVSLFFRDLDMLSGYDGPTFLIKLLSPRFRESQATKLECREITRENMSIPGNVSDRQHARRDPDELHNDSRNLATPSGVDDDVEDSEKRRN